MSAERPVPGQRLARRLFRRAAQRPAFGTAPTFFGRFGLADPYAAPDGEGAASEGMFSFLSAVGYYRERDAAWSARRRLMGRLGFESRGERLLARLTPASRAGVSLTTAPAVMAEAGPVYLEQSAGEVSEEGTEQAEPVARARKVPSRPAKTLRGRRLVGESVREGERAGQAVSRLGEAEPTARAVQPLARRVARRSTDGDVLGQLESLASRLSRSDKQRLARVVRRISTLAEPQQAAAASRALRTASSLRARSIAAAQVAERGRQTSRRPADVARDRQGGSGGKGLQRVLGRSPALVSLEVAEVPSERSAVRRRSASPVLRESQSRGRPSAVVPSTVRDARLQQNAGRAGPGLGELRSASELSTWPMPAAARLAEAPRRRAAPTARLAARLVSEASTSSAPLHVVGASVASTVPSVATRLGARSVAAVTTRARPALARRGAGSFVSSADPLATSVEQAVETLSGVAHAAGRGVEGTGLAEMPVRLLRPVDLSTAVLARTESGDVEAVEAEVAAAAPRRPSTSRRVSRAEGGESGWPPGARRAAAVPAVAHAVRRSSDGVAVDATGREVLLPRPVGARRVGDAAREGGALRALRREAAAVRLDSRGATLTVPLAVASAPEVRGPALRADADGRFVRSSVRETTRLAAEMVAVASVDDAVAPEARDERVLSQRTLSARPASSTMRARQAEATLREGASSRALRRSVPAERLDSRGLGLTAPRAVVRDTPAAGVTSFGQTQSDAVSVGIRRVGAEDRVGVTERTVSPLSQSDMVSVRVDKEPGEEVQTADIARTAKPGGKSAGATARRRVAAGARDVSGSSAVDPSKNVGVRRARLSATVGAAARQGIARTDGRGRLMASPRLARTTEAAPAATRASGQIGRVPAVRTAEPRGVDASRGGLTAEGVAAPTELGAVARAASRAVATDEPSGSILSRPARYAQVEGPVELATRALAHANVATLLEPRPLEADLDDDAVASGETRARRRRVAAAERGQHGRDGVQQRRAERRIAARDGSLGLSETASADAALPRAVARAVETGRLVSEGRRTSTKVLGELPSLVPAVAADAVSQEAVQPPTSQKVPRSRARSARPVARAVQRTAAAVDRAGARSGRVAGSPTAYMTVARAQLGVDASVADSRADATPRGSSPVVRASLRDLPVSRSDSRGQRQLVDQATGYLRLADRLSRDSLSAPALRGGVAPDAPRTVLALPASSLEPEDLGVELEGHERPSLRARRTSGRAGTSPRTRIARSTDALRRDERASTAARVASERGVVGTAARGAIGRGLARLGAGEAYTEDAPVGAVAARTSRRGASTGRAALRSSSAPLAVLALPVGGADTAASSEAGGPGQVGASVGRRAGSVRQARAARRVAPQRRAAGSRRAAELAPVETGRQVRLDGGEAVDASTRRLVERLATSSLVSRAALRVLESAEAAGAGVPDAARIVATRLAREGFSTQATERGVVRVADVAAPATVLASGPVEWPEERLTDAMSSPGARLARRAGARTIGRRSTAARAAAAARGGASQAGSVSAGSPRGQRGELPPGARVAAASVTGQVVDRIQARASARQEDRAGLLGRVADEEGSLEGVRQHRQSAALGSMSLASTLPDNVSPDLAETASTSGARSARRSGVRETRQRRSDVGRSPVEGAAARAEGYSMAGGRFALPADGGPESGAASRLGGGGLIGALARASRAEDVVRVILDRADAAQAMSGELPGEAGRLVRRIVGEAASEAAEQTNSTVSASRGDTRAATTVRTVRRDVLRPVRTFGGGHGTPSASAKSSQGVGAGNVMKLANRLRGLIHLAENERRLRDAQSQVRMAEDTDSARAEGGAGASEGAEDKEKVDIKALQQEVLEGVLSELERLQSRREDPDGRSKWW